MAKTYKMLVRQLVPSLLVAIPIVKSLAFTQAAFAVVPDCPICVDTRVECPGSTCAPGVCEGWNVDSCGSGEICSTFCGGACTGTC